MKKSLILLALSALMIPAFIACNKDDSKDENAAKFEAPKFQKSAQKLTLKHGDIKSIEFTESGRYIMEKVVTKAEESVFFTGTFTVNGTTYTLSGDFKGTVEVSGTGANVSVTVSEDGQAAVTVSAEAEEPASDDTVFRTWTIDNLRIKVTGGDLKDAGVSYTTSNGADLDEIAKYLKDNGVNFNAEEYKGYNIKTITVSGCGGFIVEFTGAEAYVGSSNVSSTSFSYDFTVGTGGSNLINAKGNGSIGYVKDICVLMLNGTIKGETKQYKVVLEFRLKEVK
ncbi:MAG: hypothetical protein IKR96_02140 [Bacteroidales bacterium]|nr:hypothetical protein [Bacteroidales bacterium]